MFHSLDYKIHPHQDSENIEQYPEVPLLHKSHCHQCLGNYAKHGCESVRPRLTGIEQFEKESESDCTYDADCRNNEKLGQREAAGIESFPGRCSSLSPLPKTHELHRKIIKGIHGRISISRGFEGDIGIEHHLNGPEEEIPDIALGSQHHTGDSGDSSNEPEYIIL